MAFFDLEVSRSFKLISLRLRQSKLCSDSAFSAGDFTERVEMEGDRCSIDMARQRQRGDLMV